MDPNLAAYAAQNREEQQEEGGLLDALGKIALGAGALAAGAIGARRLAQGLKTGATVDLSSFSPKNVRRVAAEYLVPKEVVPPSRSAPTTAVQRQQEAIEFTRQARAERPTGVRQANLTELAAAQRLAEDPELLRLVKQQEAENLSEARSYQAKAQAEYRNLLSAKADEALASIRNEGTTGAAAAQQDFAAQYLKTAGYQDDVTMVDQQAGNLIAQIDHFANASNSAEDQVTGRVKAALARNEDVNLGAVEIAEDQVDAQIARAVQGDPTVASVTEVDAAINQVADGLPDGRPVDQAEALPIGPVSAQEMVEQAKQEMLARRQTLTEAGFQPGTVRFERALAQPFRTSTAARLTGTNASQTALPTGPIRQVVQAVSASEELPETLVSNIGPQAVVTKTAAGTAIRGASPSYHEALPKQETRLLYGTAEALVPGAPEELGQDIPGKARVRGVVSSLEPEERSKQEIIYSVLDRPAPQEIPGGSAGIGVYGVEAGYVPGAVSKATGEYSAAAERRPTQPTFKERKTGFEGLTSEQLVSAAEQAQSPRMRSAFEEEAARRATTKTSLDVSEALRRARIEGRDPQAILRQFGIGR